METTQGERPLDSPSPIRGSLSSFTQSTPVKQEKKPEATESPAKRTRRVERIPLAERMRPTEFDEIMVSRCNALLGRETLMSSEKRRQCGRFSSETLPRRSFSSDHPGAGKRRLPLSSPTTHPVRSARFRAAQPESKTSGRSRPRPPKTDRRRACQRFCSWTKSTASTRSSKTSFFPTSSKVSWCSSAPRRRTPPSPSTTWRLHRPLTPRPFSLAAKWFRSNSSPSRTCSPFSAARSPATFISSAAESSSFSSFTAGLLQRRHAAPAGDESRRRRAHGAEHAGRVRGRRGFSHGQVSLPPPCVVER